MNLDLNDLKKKSKAHENRSDSFTDNDGETYRGFKSNTAPLNSIRSFHQDKTLEKHDSSNFQTSRETSDFLEISDLTESNDKSPSEVYQKKVGESSKMNSTVDMMDAFMQVVCEIRAEVKKTYLTCDSPKTKEDLARELEHKQLQLMEISFLQKHGSNMPSVTELKWGSPIKPSGTFHRTEPEKRPDSFFAKKEKKPCYMPNSPSSNVRTKSTLMRPFDMPDSPTTSIAADTYYGNDRASKRKAKDQISSFANNEDGQSDEDNETVKDDYVEVTSKKRKNNRGKNKNPQNKPTAKKNEGNKNQRKLFKTDQNVVDIEMMEETKETIDLSDEEDMFVPQTRKNMSITKRLSLSTELLKKSQEKQSVEEQTRSDEAYARQLDEEEQAEDKKMEADMASRSSSIPHSRYTKKNNNKQKEKEEQIDCPMCNKKFPKTKIEQHAADCQGVD